MNKVRILEDCGEMSEKFYVHEKWFVLLGESDSKDWGETAITYHSPRKAWYLRPDWGQISFVVHKKKKPDSPICITKNVLKQMGELGSKEVELL